MWVVWIVLKLLLNQVDEKIISKRTQLRIMQKAKQNFLYLITGNLANSSNILNVANNLIKLYLITLYCYKCRLILNNHFLF